MRTHTGTTKSTFSIITCQSIPQTPIDPSKTHKWSMTQRKYPLGRSFGGNSSSVSEEEAVAAAAREEEDVSSFIFLGIVEQRFGLRVYWTRGSIREIGDHAYTPAIAKGVRGFAGTCPVEWLPGRLDRGNARPCL